MVFVGRGEGKFVFVDVKIPALVAKFSFEPTQLVIKRNIKRIHARIQGYNFLSWFITL